MLHQVKHMPVDSVNWKRLCVKDVRCYWPPNWSLFGPCVRDPQVALKGPVKLPGLSAPPALSALLYCHFQVTCMQPFALCHRLVTPGLHHLLCSVVYCVLPFVDPIKTNAANNLMNYIVLKNKSIFKYFIS